MKDSLSILFSGKKYILRIILAVAILGSFSIGSEGIFGIDNLSLRRTKSDVSLETLLLQLRNDPGSITWSEVAMDIQLDILDVVAKELGKDRVSSLTWDDYGRNLDCLGGNSLAGLRDYYCRMLIVALTDFSFLPAHIQGLVSEEQIRGLAASLFMREVFSSLPAVPQGTVSYESEVANLIATLSSDSGTVQWEEVPVIVQRKLLEKLGLDVTSLTSEQLLRNHYDTISGHTISGLYFYYLRVIKRACSDFSTLPAIFNGLVTEAEIKELGGTEFMHLVLSRATEESLPAIPATESYASLNDVITTLSAEGKRVQWKKVTFAMQRELLRKAAEELKKEVNEITLEDLGGNLGFIGGHTLWGLYSYHRSVFNAAKENFSTLPSTYQGLITEGEIQNITAMGFMKIVLSRAAEKTAVEDVQDAGINTQETKYYASLNDVITTLSTEGKRVQWKKVTFAMQRELLRKAAEELKKEVNEITFQDFQTHFKFIGGHTLGSLYLYHLAVFNAATADFSTLPSVYQNLITKGEIQSMTAVAFIKTVLNHAAEKTAETKGQGVDQGALSKLIAVLSASSGEGFSSWESVPLAVQRELLQKSADELGIPLSNLNEGSFEHNFEFLQGASLVTMSNYYQSMLDSLKSGKYVPASIRGKVNAERAGRMVFSEFIRVIFDIPAPPDADIKYDNIDNLVADMKSRNHINWDEVSLEVQRQLLDKAAEELKIDIGQISSTSLRNIKFEFLEGRTLLDFMDYYSSHLSFGRIDFTLLPQRLQKLVTEQDLKKLDNIGFIRKILGITESSVVPYASLQEVVDIFFSDGENINWDRFPLVLQRQLIQRACDELGIDIGNISYSALQGKFIFINNRSFGPILTHYAAMLKQAKSDFNSLPQVIKDVVSEEEIKRFGVIEFMKKILGITNIEDDNEQSFSDITELINALRFRNRNMRINWDNVPFDMQRDLLQRACDELGVDIESANFTKIDNKKLSFLDGRTLDSLLNYYKTNFSYGKSDFNLLSEPLKAVTTKEKIKEFSNVSDFIRSILGIFETVEDNDNISPGEEKQWMADFEGLDWEMVAANSPRQIAFYVRGLVCYLAQRNGGFTDLASLLNARSFNVIVPTFGRSLIGIFNYFGDSYSLIQYLEQHGLIAQIEQEVKARLGK